MTDKKFRIVSDGKSRGTKIYLGEEDISNRCIGATISISSDGVIASLEMLVTEQDIKIIKDAVLVRYYNGEGDPSLAKLIEEELEAQILKAREKYD